MSALTYNDVTEVFVGIQPALEDVAFRRIGCRETARDLSQDMFFKLERLAARFATRDDARRFLIRMAINAATDHYRVEHRRAEILAETLETTRDNGHSIDRELEVNDEMRRIELALGDLPAKCRDVLYLSRIEGLSHAEIAQRLGVSRSLIEKYAVKAMLYCRDRLIVESSPV